jgi:very-short-patch-repair endonuclease
MRNKIIPYNPKLKDLARQLRKNSTLSEVLLWQKIKNKGLGVQFHRQVPMLNYIVDFYCHEIMLAIEIDGDSHLHKYEYDKKREGELEQMGVKFIRFNDIDVKKNMFSVTLSLEQTVSVILKESNTPLWSPQGDNPSDRQLK